MTIPGTDFDILFFLVAMAFFLFGAWFGRFMTRYPFGRKPFTGMEAIIGSTGQVSKIRNEILEVTVQGQTWVAESDRITDIRTGDYVLIEGIEGMRLKVSKKH